MVITVVFACFQDAFFGDFANNKPDGDIIAYYCDGSKHTGTFREGTRHGRGTTQEENGNRVIGTWDKDKRDGVFEVGRWVVMASVRLDWVELCRTLHFVGPVCLAQSLRCLVEAMYQILVVLQR